MLIYEKNNKLNISFDNKVSENPDLQISKEDGKTQVLIDGQPGGGGDVSQLPVVDISDDGKFLCVINGEWLATTVPSAKTTNF
jgi:hypothetical protein